MRRILSTYVDRAYESLASYTGAKVNRMEMGREVIADRGIWVAENVILNVHDNEGVRYKKPKLKLMGIEVKSSTPQIVREKMKRCLRYWLVVQNQKHRSLSQTSAKTSVHFPQKMYHSLVE